MLTIWTIWNELSPMRTETFTKALCGLLEEKECLMLSPVSSKRAKKYGVGYLSENQNQKLTFTIWLAFRGCGWRLEINKKESSSKRDELTPRNLKFKTQSNSLHFKSSFSLNAFRFWTWLVSLINNHVDIRNCMVIARLICGLQRKFVKFWLNK